ncbi:hypothetical protein BN938_1246 [Mucinivorans hirudinis]|uniref:Helix-turn-helix domain-containing protein n=1 Tax=Mucinivorans hirudinis TaxID=1433126 RepID=A0A060RCZ1_9BACT|nr:hypothetical protein BN938_1246 [Mucinivorans hirudinis]
MEPLEQLDRATFEMWMERIMERFDEFDRRALPTFERPVIDGEALIDNQEVCQMFRISKRTLQRYRADGLPSYMVYHKTWYKRSDMEAFLKSHFDENIVRKRERKEKSKK